MKVYKPVFLQFLINRIYSELIILKNFRHLCFYMKKIRSERNSTNNSQLL